MCFNWLKRAFLGKRFAKNGKEFDGGKLDCPRCGKAMEKLKKFDVVIDHCNKCGGMWLDDKEIEKLYGYYSGKRKVPKKNLNK